MFSVPPDAGKTALGSIGVITLFAVGLVIAPLTIDVTLGQTKLVYV